MLDWMGGESPVASALRTRPAGIVGHSRGALPAIVLAAERPAVVGAVVSWNGIGKALRYSEAQLGRWEQDGKMEFTNARTGQRMAVDWGFVVDAREHAGRFDLPARVQEMQAAHLILHAQKDMAVPVEEAERLLAGRTPGERVQLKVLEGGSHTFNAVHPFAGTTPSLERAVWLTEEWFTRHLRAG